MWVENGKTAGSVKYYRASSCIFWTSLRWADRPLEFCLLWGRCFACRP
jgi:hypothetical protein